MATVMGRVTRAKMGNQHLGGDTETVDGGERGISTTQGKNSGEDEDHVEEEDRKKKVFLLKRCLPLLCSLCVKPNAGDS